MVNYLCDRCHYKTTYKHHFVSHLIRQNTCEPIHSAMSVKQISDNYDIFLDFSKIESPNTPPNAMHSMQNGMHGMPHNMPNGMPITMHSLSVQSSSIPTHNNSIINDNYNKINTINNLSLPPSSIPDFTNLPHECDFCNRKFLKKYYLTDHLKVCKKKKKIEYVNGLKTQIEELSKENLDIKNKLNNRNKFIYNLIYSNFYIVEEIYNYLIYNTNINLINLQYYIKNLKLQKKNPKQ